MAAIDHLAAAKALLHRSEKEKQEARFNATKVTNMFRESRKGAGLSNASSMSDVQKGLMSISASMGAMAKEMRARIRNSRPDELTEMRQAIQEISNMMRNLEPILSHDTFYAAIQFLFELTGDLLHDRAKK